MMETLSQKNGRKTFSGLPDVVATTPFGGCRDHVLMQASTAQPHKADERSALTHLLSSGLLPSAPVSHRIC
jgi:hypothetical protein